MMGNADTGNGNNCMKLWALESDERDVLWQHLSQNVKMD
jgi:hypothetical protein